MNTDRSRILALRVINQIRADRRTLALIVVAPVILLTFLGILIRADQGTLAVAVVNNDAGFSLAGADVNLGDRLINVMQSFSEFEIRDLTADEAQPQFKAGDLDAVITVPADFTQTVIQTRTLALEVEFEGSNPMIADRLNTMFERVALQAANTLALAGSPAAASPSPADVDFTTTLDATYLHGGADYDTLDYMAPAMIGFFVFFFVFLLTCISFLRERVAGTLERLQATPIRSLEIIIGYMLGFLVFGLLQGVVTLLFTVLALDIHYAGNLLTIFVVEALLVALSVNLGIFLSTFAQNEFQVLQFIPLVITTQGLLGGVVWQIDDMPRWLQPIAEVMPLTHATRALRAVMITGDSLADVWGSLLVLMLYAAAVVFLSARTAGRTKI